MLDLQAIKEHPDPGIQARWTAGQVPCFVGIAVGDGALVAMKATNFVDVSGVRQIAAPTCRAEIGSFDELCNQYVDVVRHGRPVAIPGTDLQVIFGEGEMGNEGFVAVTAGSVLIWSAFFDNSNPFIRAAATHDSVIAETEHENAWLFPVLEPWKVTIRQRTIAD